MNAPKSREGGVYEDRRLIGRSISGLHAEQYPGCPYGCAEGILDHGPVFRKVELIACPGGNLSQQCWRSRKPCRHLPRIEFSYRVAKRCLRISRPACLPLSLNLPDAEVMIRTESVSMRPGIDQLPGTNMEYYIADEGLVYRTKIRRFWLITFDTPLLYMGRWNPIQSFCAITKRRIINIRFTAGL